jgi:hypothetical protein
VDQTLAEAWERHHGFMTDLSTVGMEDYWLSQEAKEHIDAPARRTFFMLNIEKARALFEKLSPSKRESEEYDLKENSRTVEIDLLTRKFLGMALT